ncbi:MAG: NADP-dependent phosphogluconate dehydrogenase [Cyanobacteriota bacterium]|nr:NADP-dependent phosphogluconate dehydrogenase [Cyanobacteriota bacterium]
MSQPSFAVIGLAVMGENLALNVERNGFPIAVYNRTAEKTKQFMQERAQGKNVTPAYTLAELVQVMARPRKFLIMVKAGGAVDAVINELKPLLDEGDILIDGGNSLYTDTDRRAAELAPTGIHFVGMGVSGGEEGALNGPSLMPGCSPESYQEIEPIVTKIAAQVPDGPCVTYLGPKGGGHYVKMVHNGIEYGDMQLIAEVYDLMRRGLGLSAEAMHETFAAWNQTELESFLIEITAKIFTTYDAETGKPLVDVILDKAGQKGTGLWTVKDALDLGVSIPTIDAAVNARILSSIKAERVVASSQITGLTDTFNGDKVAFISDLKDALYCSKVCSYAQGMDLLKKAATAHGYIYTFSEIPRIWKGGCIIRAQFLGEIQSAFQRDPDLVNLLLDPEFKQALVKRQPAWRRVVATAAQLGIPIPAMSASLNYFDSYRTANLPQNLTQAQRDFFGAHTFERVDKPGSFHHEWMG